MLLPSAANTALLVAPDGVLAVVVAAVAVCELNAAEGRSSRLPFMLTLALDDRRSLRLLEEANAAELYAVVRAHRAYLARWMPWAEKQAPHVERRSNDSGGYGSEQAFAPPVRRPLHKRSAVVRTSSARADGFVRKG